MVNSCPIAKWSVIWMPFEYRTKFCQVFGTPFEYRTGIQMVVWIPNYHLNTGHLNTGQEKVRYSDVRYIDPHCIKWTKNSSTVTIEYPGTMWGSVLRFSPWRRPWVRAKNSLNWNIFLFVFLQSNVLAKIVAFFYDVIAVQKKFRSRRKAHFLGWGYYFSRTLSTKLHSLATTHYESILRPIQS